jgi:hypothetical protein
VLALDIRARARLKKCLKKVGKAGIQLAMIPEVTSADLH